MAWHDIKLDSQNSLCVHPYTFSRHVSSVFCFPPSFDTKMKCRTKILTYHAPPCCTLPGGNFYTVAKLPKTNLACFRKEFFGPPPVGPPLVYPPPGFSAKRGAQHGGHGISCFFLEFSMFFTTLFMGGGWVLMFKMLRFKPRSEPSFEYEAREGYPPCISLLRPFFERICHFQIGCFCCSLPKKTI